MTADRRGGLERRGLPGMEHDRLWSRLSPRAADPLGDAGACSACKGTAVNVDQPDFGGPCRSCDGTGWAP